MSVLETRDAVVNRGGRTILGPASVRIGPGELTALIGPNGSGKSTLLRLFAGLWKPDSGDVLLDDRTIQNRSRKEIARRISFVPQETQIDFSFTVSEILAMGRYPHRGRFASQTADDRQAIQSAAEHCDVAHLMTRAVNTLSGGERQRVLIARSLVVQPDFVLLDEPTANLDIQHALDILQLCRALTEGGKTVVVATHDFNIVTRYATRLVLLQTGKIVSQGTQTQVIDPDIIKHVFKVEAELVSTRAGDQLYVFRSCSTGRSGLP
jgi:iron complex transport system ATP-binding protein